MIWLYHSKPNNFDCFDLIVFDIFSLFCCESCQIINFDTFFFILIHNSNHLFLSLLDSFEETEVQDSIPLNDLRFDWLLDAEPVDLLHCQTIKPVVSNHCSGDHKCSKSSLEVLPQKFEIHNILFWIMKFDSRY